MGTFEQGDKHLEKGRGEKVIIKMISQLYLVTGFSFFFNLLFSEETHYPFRLFYNNVNHLLKCSSQAGVDMRGLDLGTGVLVHTSGNSTCYQATPHFTKTLKRHLSVNNVQARCIFIGMPVRVVCEEV